MMKKIAVNITLCACILVTPPVFADDSDLYPEPIPRDQQPQQSSLDNPGLDSGYQQSMSDQDNPQLSPQEENIYGQAQAQFEEEQNALQPGRTSSLEAQNNKLHEEQALQQDHERLGNDTEGQDRLRAEVDRMRIKDDEALMRKTPVDSRMDETKVIHEEDSRAAMQAAEDEMAQKQHQAEAPAATNQIVRIVHSKPDAEPEQEEVLKKPKVVAPARDNKIVSILHSKPDSEPAQAEASLKTPEVVIPPKDNKFIRIVRSKPESEPGQERVLLKKPETVAPGSDNKIVRIVYASSDFEADPSEILPEKHPISVQAGDKKIVHRAEPSLHAEAKQDKAVVGKHQVVMQSVAKKIVRQDAAKSKQSDKLLKANQVEARAEDKKMASNEHSKWGSETELESGSENLAQQSINRSNALEW